MPSKPRLDLSRASASRKETKKGEAGYASILAPAALAAVEHVALRGDMGARDKPGSGKMGGDRIPGKSSRTATASAKQPTEAAKAPQLNLSVKPRIKRRKNPAAHVPSEAAPVLLNAELLKQHFHLPLSVAAKKIGVCTTALKQGCRKIGIKNWPHRKLKMIVKQLGDMEASKNKVLEEQKRQAAEAIAQGQTAFFDANGKEEEEDEEDEMEEMQGLIDEPDLESSSMSRHFESPAEASSSLMTNSQSGNDSGSGSSVKRQHHDDIRNSSGKGAETDDDEVRLLLTSNANDQEFLDEVEMMDTSSWEGSHSEQACSLKAGAKRANNKSVTSASPAQTRAERQNDNGNPVNTGVPAFSAPSPAPATSSKAAKSNAEAKSKRTPHQSCGATIVKDTAAAFSTAHEADKGTENAAAAAKPAPGAAPANDDVTNVDAACTPSSWTWTALQELHSMQTLTRALLSEHSNMVNQLLIAEEQLLQERMKCKQLQDHVEDLNQTVSQMQADLQRRGIKPAGLMAGA